MKDQHNKKIFPKFRTQKYFYNFLNFTSKFRNYHFYLSHGGKEFYKSSSKIKTKISLKIFRIKKKVETATTCLSESENFT